MSVRRLIRWHHPDGQVVVQTMVAFQTANGLTRGQAMDQLTSWLLDGSISERRDGGFDIHRFHPAKHPQVPRPRPRR